MELGLFWLFQGTYVTVCAYLYEAEPVSERVHHCLLTVVLSFLF